MCTIGPDGSALRRITGDHGNMSHPGWSSYGRRLAFTGSAGDTNDDAALHPYNPQLYGEIALMRADGSERHALTDNQFEAATPRWVPPSGSQPHRCGDGALPTPR